MDKQNQIPFRTGQNKPQENTEEDYRKKIQRYQKGKLYRFCVIIGGIALIVLLIKMQWSNRLYTDYYVTKEYDWHKVEDAKCITLGQRILTYSKDGMTCVDKEGQPWMVFVHEWTSTDNGIGRMCYAKLSSDLSRFVEEPVEIFAADDPSWTDECVTDGCYMYRTEDGELLMIWSNFASDEFNNYTIGIAKSSNGEIDGNWIQQDEVLHTFDNTSVYSVFNGGHGMIFEGYDGQKYITFHAPNNAGEWMTYIMFVPIVERNGTIYLDKIVK